MAGLVERLHTLTASWTERAAAVRDPHERAAFEACAADLRAKLEEADALVGLTPYKAAGGATHLRDDHGRLIHRIPPTYPLDPPPSETPA